MLYNILIFHLCLLYPSWVTVFSGTLCYETFGSAVIKQNPVPLKAYSVQISVEKFIILSYFLYFQIKVLATIYSS
jgi:hypothetical protein